MTWPIRTPPCLVPLVVSRSRTSMPARRATYEIGTRRVTVTGGEEGPHQTTVTVRLGATTVVN